MFERFLTIFKWFIRLYYASYLLAFIIAGTIGSIVAVVLLTQGHVGAALGIVGSIVPIAVVLAFAAWVFGDVQRQSALIDRRRAALGLPPRETDDDEEEDDEDDSEIDDDDVPGPRRRTGVDEAIRPAREQ